MIYHGDCLAVLRTLPDCSVDAVVTDPPYGLSFMGKRWDYDVPSEEVWRECLRVLKPGGHLLAFAGTRTQHRMAVRIEDAGFEIRDMIAWVYGSGFPKSHNLSGEWQGWGTALKPALEPITVARKPLAGTVAENVLVYGTGALNIDGCRINPGEQVPGGGNGKANHGGNFAGEYKGERSKVEPHTAGRWPANLIHDGSEEVLAAFPQAPGQQGDLKETGRPRPSSGRFGDMAPPHAHPARIESDKRSARFFYCAKASKRDRDEGLEGFAEKATAFGNQAIAEMKRGNLEHADGKSGMNKVKMRQNTHPTVKPTDLMRYLCRLITPPGGTVLDPFMGSGSTGKAAVLEGLSFIGIEREAEYVEIAKARIAAAQAQPKQESLF